MIRRSMTKRQTLIRNIAALFVGGAILAPGMAPEAHAQLYWDSNGTTAGAGVTPTGTWGTSNFWNTDSAGGALGVFQTTTTSSNDVFFSAGTDAVNPYTVGLNSTTQNARLVTFEDGTATLNTGTLSLGGAGGLTVATTTVTGATISSNLTISGNNTFNVGASRTLTFDNTGTFTRNTGATLNVQGTGTVNTTKSNLAAGSLVNDIIGPWATFNSGANTTYATIDGSNNIIGLTYAGGATGVVPGVASTVTDTSGLLNYSVNTATGTLGTNASINTLRYTAAASTLTTATSFTTNGILNAGTGALNLAGDVTIGSTLQLVVNAANSGVTFANRIVNNGANASTLIITGSGGVTMNSATSSTYTGGTIVNQGTLSHVADGTGLVAFFGTGPVTINPGATLGLNRMNVINLVNLNGATLSAGNSFTSTLAGGVTLTGANTFNITGGLAISSNFTGSGTLTKIGASTITFSSGTTYNAGALIISGGGVAFATQASLFGGASANWTAANISVGSGATLALNVDSAGTAGFTSANLSTLLGNISVANTATQGLQRGAIISINTGTATGSTFTYSTPITNSTGAFGGVISLTKIGAGTLIFDQANTYTGPTTISAGTLQLNAGGVIATPIGNNATFAINSAGSVTQGTNFGLIAGTGAVTKAGAGTLTLNLANTYSGTTTVSAGTLALTNALALQNSALVTTSGTTTYSGGAALTIGGLSGATGDLGSANVLNGYTGLVTALTLNPQTGVSVTYGGVISNGSGAMTLTKTGAGTQILTGANTYTGATIVNAGTLTVGAGGSISSSSALQINGGTFSYGNTAAGQTLNGLAVGAGNATVSNTSTTQTLTLGAITRTASLFGTVNFATLTSPISTTTGNVNSIIGPWATTGSTTTLRYAVGSADGSTPTSISAFTGTTATVTTLANVTDAAMNYEYSAAATTATDLTANTLRYSGGATSTAIGATNTLTLNGLMNAGTGLLTISGGPSSGGILTGSTGELVIAANAQATSISAVIGGTGRLVYSGGGTLTLGISNASTLTNTYTGGTVINSGTVLLLGLANNDVNSILGGTSGGITLNGGLLQVSGANINAARIVTVNGTGSSMRVGRNNNFTTTGKLTGDGTLTTVDNGGSGALSTYSFNSTSNDFTGRLIGTNTIINVNSLGNSTNSIVLDGTTFNYGTGATAATSLPNRAIELSGTTGGATITNSNTTAANTLSIGGGLIVTGVGNKTLTLGGANTGNNTFSGIIADGPGSQISLTKTLAGTWIISGANSYTGATTISAGTLAGIGSNAFGSTSGISIAAAGTLSLRGDASTTFANSNVTTSASGSTINVNQATIAGTTAKTMTIGTLGTTSVAATYQVNFTGANNTSLNVGAVTGAASTAAATVTLDNAIASTGTLTLASYTSANTAGGENLTFSGAGLTTVTGNITPSTTTLSLTKNGTGTVILAGSNPYTGATAVNAGTLRVDGSLTGTSGITLFGSSLVLKTGSAVNVSGALGTSTAIGNNITIETGATLNAGSINIPWNTAIFQVDGSLASSGNFNVATNATTTLTGTGNITTTTGSIGNAATVFVINKPSGALSYSGLLTLGTTTATHGGTVTLTSGTVNAAAGIQLGTGTSTVAQTVNLNGGRINLGANITALGTGARNLNFNDGIIGASANWNTSLNVNLAGTVAGTTFNTLDSVNNTTARTITLSGAVGGTGKLNKDGAGTLVLTNTNNYSGATTVSAGTLSIGTVATPTGSINNSSGVTINGATANLNYNSSTALTAPVTLTAGTISGSGTIGTPVTITSGSTIAPGNSPGAMTYADVDLTWNAGGNYNWQVVDATGLPGTGYDTINITGVNGDLLFSGLSPSTQFNINLQSLSSITPDTPGIASNFVNTNPFTWTLVSTANTIAGFNAAHFNINSTNFAGAGGGTFSVELADGNTDLVLKFAPSTGGSPDLAVGAVTGGNLFVLQNASLTTATASVALSNGNTNTGAVTGFTPSNAVLTATTGQSITGAGAVTPNSVISLLSTSTNTTALGATVTYTTTPADTNTTNNTATVNVRIGNASYAGGDSSATPGTALSAATALSGTFTNLASNTVGLTSTGTTVPAIGTTATLLYYKNSTGDDTGVSMAWRSRKTVEASSAVPGDNGSTAVGYLISDVVTLTGMQNVTGVNATTANQTDIFVLQMSYDQNKLGVDIASAANHEAAGGALGRIYLAWNDTLNGGWTNAVNGNIGGTNEFVFRGYLPGDELVLGRWGVDISNNVAWAVLNHNSEFAVIPEPSTLVLGGLALLGLAGAGLRRRRLAKQA